MDVSVVISLLNEEESLAELYEWIARVMRENALSYEVVFIDDGSNDTSWTIIESLAATYPEVKAIKFRRNYGKSAALHCGFQVAQGDVVVTMDADLQDNPEEIPDLHRMVMQEGFDLVSGWKQKRYDPVFTKNIPSKFYNWMARKMSGIYLHDFNCGLKAYRNTVVKSIEVYGEMHRYIPVIAKNAGFYKIGEKVVQHQKRKYGVSKFGIERFLNGALDLISISFITKFSKRPMHFFGTMGALVSSLGFFVTVWLIVEKMYKIARGVELREVTSQPLFFLALTSMVIGVQLFLAGFLAELISRSASERNTYQIEKTLGEK